MRKLALVALLIGTFALANKAPTKTVVFSGKQVEVKKYLENLFETSKKVNSKGKSRLRARAAIEGALHWPTVARSCLGSSTWKKNPKDRGKFQQLLKEVVSLTAYTRITKFWKGTTYSFKKIDVKGKNASVDVLFSVEDEDDVELSYFLTKRGKRWYITDLSYEDFKYSENIREQIEDYLSEGNFKSLLSKLRKRRNDLKSEEKAQRDGKPGKKKKG